MKITSKTLFYLINIFFIINMIDFFTALFILGGESNPVYLMTGSMMPVFILKIGMSVLLYYVYFRDRYKTRFMLFNYIYLICIGIFMVSFGVYSNVIGIMNNEVVETASSLSNEEKKAYYYSVMLWLMIIPYIISMIAFKIYDITEKNIRY